MRLILSILGLIVLVVGHLTAEPELCQANPGMLMLMGTLVSAGSAIMSGFAGMQQAKTQAAISEYNAAVAGQKGAAEERRSEIEAKRFQREAAALEAEQVAKYGKSGVMFSGSPLTVMAETAKNLEIDRQMILQEGYQAKLFREAEAKGFQMEASGYREQGRYALLSGVAGGASTALQGFGAYKGYKRTGQWLGVKL